MKRLLWITPVLAATLWHHRCAVLLAARKTSVSLGVHFPLPYTGMCVCGLPLSLLSSHWWFDTQQLDERRVQAALFLAYLEHRRQAGL